MSSDLSWLSGPLAGIAGQAGVGGVAGYVLGWGLKKIIMIALKILAVIATLVTLLIAWLASQGWITINPDRVAQSIQDSGSGLINGAPGLAGQSFSWISTFLSQFGGLGVGLVAGFALALSKK